MQPLPECIKEKFFKFLYGETSMRDFEQWVYQTGELEQVLGNDDYFLLISVNFSTPGNRYEIFQILERHIRVGEYETWRLKILLTNFTHDEKQCFPLLVQFYELYCNGYFFLDHLGLGYGLSVIVPPNRSESELWQELSPQEQVELVKMLRPGAIAEAQKILSWLEQGKIIITDQLDEFDRCLVVDKRSEAEKL